MPEGYHHVTQDIRCQIYALKATGTPLNKIASIVGYHVSSISREINRNTGGRGYRYKQANNMAIERRSSASCTRKRLTKECITIIRKRLKQGWSPEQISGRSKLEGIDMVSHEAIYQYVWQDLHCGGNLYKNLRHHNKKYNKPLQARQAVGVFLIVLISQNDHLSWNKKHA